VRVEQRDHTQELHVQLEQRFGILLDLQLQIQLQIRWLSSSNARDSRTRSRILHFTGSWAYRPNTSYNLETSSCATSICLFSPGTLSTASVFVDPFSASRVPVSASMEVSRKCYEFISTNTSAKKCTPTAQESGAAYQIAQILDRLIDSPLAA
jgi:outer membrane receptor for Fe3+-dicitrate